MDQKALEILYLALAEPIGLVIQTSDPVRARQRLYSARRTAGEVDFSGLQIRSGEAPGELLIVHQRPSGFARAEQKKEKA